MLSAYMYFSSLVIARNVRFSQSLSHGRFLQQMMLCIHKDRNSEVMKNYHFIVAAFSSFFSSIGVSVMPLMSDIIIL